eukprot:GHVU01057319.1.p1 GENE.GHVU01057319.1~~GHVU01057319.1.p1  ORF type:complete len:121 (-),score=9.73 GHVU01057319.1:112-474(-)
MWSGFMWEKAPQSSFRKIRGLAFDHNDTLWALNRGGEVACWDESNAEWLKETMPGTVRPRAICFDAFNRFWVVGSNKELLLMQGGQWVNYGYVGCWKFADVSFKYCASGPNGGSSRCINR